MKSNEIVSDLSIQSAVSSSESVTANDEYPVVINVYGLLKINERLKRYRAGIFHVGVQVHGHEWSYGYHRYPISGIFSYSPRNLLSLSKNDKMFSPLDPITVGSTSYSLRRITDHLNQMGRTDWTGLKYHIIYKNSANFAAKLCLFLCNMEIPRWINCMAHINKHEPQIFNQIPEDFKSPVALNEIVAQKIDFALKYQQKCKNKAIAKHNLKTAVLQKSDVDNSQSHAGESDKEWEAKSKTGESLNEESLSDILDSTIFAAPSLQDFQQEVEEETKKDD